MSFLPEEAYVGKVVTGDNGRDYVYNGEKWLLMEEVPRHAPHRGSDVAQWIKQRRGEYEVNSPPWTALDFLLDDYLLRADTGASLLEDLEEP